MQVVAGILIYRNKILAFQRGYSENSYISFKYEFPGGKKKKDETLLSALKREIKEELNIKIHKPIPYLNTSYKYPKIKVFLYFYKCYLDSLDMNLNVHSNYKLLSISQLRSVDWLKADYEVIEYIEKNGFE